MHGLETKRKEVKNPSQLIRRAFYAGPGRASRDSGLTLPANPMYLGHIYRHCAVGLVTRREGAERVERERGSEWSPVGVVVMESVGNPTTVLHGSGNWLGRQGVDE